MTTNDWLVLFVTLVALFCGPIAFFSVALILLALRGDKA